MDDSVKVNGYKFPLGKLRPVFEGLISSKQRLLAYYCDTCGHIERPS
jgi:hypothetical protein